jgi:putative sterol carrier protein
MNVEHILLTATQNFAAHYHANTKLCAEQADWNCCICLRASDADVKITAAIAGGKVVSVDGGEQTCNLMVDAPLQILIDIVELRLNPNQPYLFGELTVIGAEADFMRLDYVATMLCAN